MQPHRLDPVSLVFGLVFAALGVGFLLAPSGILELPWEWLVPVAIGAAGVAVLASVARGRSGSRALERGEPADLEP